MTKMQSKTKWQVFYWLTVYKPVLEHFWQDAVIDISDDR